MMNIAIVDDNYNDSNQLKESFDRFFSERKAACSIDVYADPLKFLDKFSSQYDLITLDIQMQSMDGITLARRIRKTDNTVIIIFVTDHVSYAVDGYEVEALDFMVKPINYFDFSLKMKRAISRYERSPKDNSVMVKTSDGFVQLQQRDIVYVEIVGHWATYHTKGGDYRYYGTLKDVEQLLDRELFCRCNSCYLVNLAHVKKVEQLHCVVGDVELRISQPKKKEFMNRLVKYYGSGGLKL